MIKKQTKDFMIQQGDDLTVEFAIVDEAGEDVDVSTGYTAKMQARVAVPDTTPIFALTESSGLTLAAGKITATFTNVATKAFVFDRALYDLEVATDPGGLVTTVYRGSITLRKEITR